jgi:hypothetical protein
MVRSNERVMRSAFMRMIGGKSSTSAAGKNNPFFGGMFPQKVAGGRKGPSSKVASSIQFSSRTAY